MLTISGYLKTVRFVLDDLGYYLAMSLGPHPGGSLLRLRSYALKSIDTTTTTTKTYTASHNDTKQQWAGKASNVIRKANKSDTLVCDLSWWICLLIKTYEALKNQKQNIGIVP